MPKDVNQSETRTPLLRKPESTDGAAIWELIKDCKPLDENSMYCNLIQADHFADTCVLAELNGEVVGWISGHMIPGENALFVWQVAVSAKARGLGLGKTMLFELLNRKETDGAVAIKTTITRDNDASWGLFRSFARAVGGELSDAPHFEKSAHFDGQHDTEHMVTIALPRAELRSAA
ncbi:diaminobutyrate acetyltransferase [Salipiger marinus]|jgi:L-2,4-diaminobutyric acid acetyltransferase|uniref:L-2,4-diaminobutyric acid acetyltransferase n=1 Tax=Salipiger marinus TaxID=555512 RepID=A0A1G8PH95_9RHOB|nr:MULTISPECIES: diaminobutyrate acetyltransferase [Salipiger]MCD1618834.1 diaminobutyrate acetyltransferase [Salipiger manganoxidans]MEB3419745.1 diaminobutyrate acetyltransferase [Salipiger manganoxidans]SDI91812.1 diaminobutyrate acetyltransferase [Salipiger marinus]HBM58729.1 diaminobutyrate acetyltransferase [Citreicella sp.]